MCSNGLPFLCSDVIVSIKGRQRTILNEPSSPLKAAVWVVRGAIGSDGALDREAGRLVRCFRALPNTCHMIEMHHPNTLIRTEVSFDETLMGMGETRTIDCGAPPGFTEHTPATIGLLFCSGRFSFDVGLNCCCIHLLHQSQVAITGEKCFKS